MSKLISIVIPLYNGSKNISKCIDSILNQNIANYEVVLVDNNSTDNSKKIIMNYCNKDKRIKYVFEKNKSRGAARNKGIKKAKGYVVLMTDIDCIVPKNWIRDMTNNIINKKENAVLGFEKEFRKSYWNTSMIRANKNHIRRIVKNGYVNHIDTKNFAIRSDIIKKNNFNTELKAMEDFDLYLRMKKKIKIKYNPRVMVIHNHNYNLREVFMTNIERGYWTTYIYYKYNDKKLGTELMTQWTKANKFLLMLRYFIHRIIDEKSKFFFIVSNLGWFLGVNYYKIKRFFLR